MGTNIIGYVEINTIRFSKENLWFDIIDISVIAEQDYSIFGLLFGIRNNINTRPIAKNRGLPNDSINSKSKNFIGEDKIGHSWINYKEIKNNINIIPLNEFTWGWKFIIDSMDKLSSHYGEENVRLIVVFDNYG
jgi:hypothetical protein